MKRRIDEARLCDWAMLALAGLTLALIAVGWA